MPGELLSKNYNSVTTLPVFLRGNRYQPLTGVALIELLTLQFQFVEQLIGLP